MAMKHAVAMANEEVSFLPKHISKGHKVVSVRLGDHPLEMKVTFANGVERIWMGLIAYKLKEALAQ